MKEIKTTPKKITKDEINLIIDYFKRGKVIVYPTDTVYGLGCLATSQKAINKIYKIKKREKSKPLLILVGSFKILRKYCFVSRKQEEYLKKIRKGQRPVSVILKKKKSLSRQLTGGLETIAVRLPNLPKSNFLIKILRGVSEPVVSTSFNISGEKILGSVSSLDNYFKKEKPDLIIDAGVIKAKPSRIVDLTDVGNIKILRK